MRTNIARLLPLVVAFAAGCDSSSSMMDPGMNPGGDPSMPMPGVNPADGLDPSVARVSVSGSIVDFVTGQSIQSAGTMVTNGMSPAPTVSVTGADYMVSGIPPYSVFYLLAGSPPDYRNTFSLPVSVVTSDVTGVAAPIVPEQYLADLQKAFVVNPTSNTGILFVQVVDGNNAPKAGVPASAFQINGSTPASGPYFLDASKKPAANLTATSASGWAVFFDVPVGTAAITTTPASGLQLSAEAPSAANTVSFAVASTAGGSMAPPTNKTMSFATDVMPIFTARGCVNCHSGDGPGRDEGGLALNGGAPRVWSAVVTQPSPNFNITRVNLQDPAKSLLLTMPLYENPPDAHPVAVFQSTSDKDYLTILTWIQQGAKDN
jgi:hypothetical protein